MACKSITVVCDRENTNYCSITSSSSINLSVENTFHFINPNYYVQPMVAILEIRPQLPSNIASIDSIFYYFPKLEQLFISNCLTDVPSMRAASSTLVWVNFRHNFIRNVSKLSFDGAPNLERIDLSTNSIYSIENEAFSGLDRLISIQMDHNRLGALKSHTFDGAPSLMRISLRNNSISIIADECFALKNLEELILAENRLEMIPESIFNGAERLKTVSFAHNKIKVINLIAVAQSAPIEILNFDDNQLGLFEKQSINCTDKMNHHLKNLNLARNKLKNAHIFDSLKCASNMEMLNFNANEFTKFENVSDLRIYFPRLSIISLIDNKIDCKWLNRTVFDTALIYTRSNRKKYTINNIECIP